MRSSIERLTDCSVLIVGDAMMDHFGFCTVDRIAPETPVPAVRVTREEDRLGGSATTDFNAKKLGVYAN